MNSLPPIEVDVLHVKQMIDQGAEFLLLDCREQDEYAVARIDGAQLLPLSEIEQRAGELDPHRDEHVLVVCHHGVRSLRLARWLRARGFESVQSMRGGIDAWSLQIDPSVPRY